MGSLKVLVVDDDPTTLQLVEARLKVAGYQVLTRQEALGTTAIVRQEKPDVVIVDVRMPALTGDRLTTLIQEHKPTPALILHSSLNATQLFELTAKCGALGFIEKSPGAANFVNEMERLLRRGGVLPEP
ncbi:MAG: response regulator [Myxococcota bacterium]